MSGGNKQIKSSDGFTIVELIMATAVFSVVLMIVVTGIIRIGQNYYKNLTENKVQETTRSIVDNISQTVQFTAVRFRTGASPNQICIGDTRYTFNINTRVDAAATPRPEALIEERIAPSDACATGAGTGRRELLSDNMRLLDFSVAPIDAAQRTWRIRAIVAYGADDLLTSYNDDGTPNGLASGNALCKSGFKGGSFCATAQLDTTVKKRLN